MKIALTAQNDNVQAAFDPRFGRSPYFILVDTATRNWSAERNPAAGQQGGAGTRAAQFLAELGVGAVVSGRFGPNAYTALEAAGIELYQARNQRTAEDVLEEYLAGTLETARSTGRGGGGRGRGRGRRR